MAHPKNEDTGILWILQASSGNGDDPIKGLLRHTIQQVLEEELTAFLNAEPYTRTEERRGYRNGYKPRTLKTRVGQLELMIPKDREGRFQTELFEKYQRNEKALVLAIAEMHVQKFLRGDTPYLPKEDPAICLQRDLFDIAIEAVKQDTMLVGIPL